MSKTDSELQQTQGNGMFAFLWQRKIWWLLPLVMLMVLLVIIYVLIHLSAADSEMYPTTQYTVMQILSC